MVKHTPSSAHPLYPRWTAIVQRCTNPNARGWKYYGARGITVCEQWRTDFRAFLADVGTPPDRARGWSLDRIVAAQGYEPGNVRWTERQAQAIHRRYKKAALRSPQPRAAEPGPRPMPVSKLGQVLIQARVTRGLTQRQLAESLGMRQQAIQRYEATNYSTLSIARFEEIAAALDLKLAITMTLVDPIE